MSDKRRVKVFKLEIMVIDFDDVGADDIKDIIENQKYPNHCIAPKVVGIQSAEVMWSDDHPLNKHATFEQEWNRLFPTENPHE